MNRDPAIVALREALEQRLEAMADEATERIVLDVPAYRAADEQFRADIRAHVVAHLHASLESLGRRPRGHPRGSAVRPPARGPSRQARIGHRVRAGVLRGRAGAVGHGARARARRRVTAGGARVRIAPAALFRGRDHARRRGLPRDPGAARGHRASGSAATCSRTCSPAVSSNRGRGSTRPGRQGSTDDSSFVVISATPYPAPDDEQLLRGGAAALARAIGGRTVPLAVVRQDEIVLVVPAVEGRRGDAHDAAHRCPAAARRRRPAARRGRQHRGVGAGADPGRLP